MKYNTKIVLIFLLVFVIIALLIMPIVKYNIWKNSTFTTIKKVLSVIYSHNPKDLLDKTSDKNYYYKKIFYDLRDMLGTDRSAFVKGKKSLKFDDSFWGIDIFGYKQKSYQITKEFNSNFDILINCMDNHKVLYDYLENLEGYMFLHKYIDVNTVKGGKKDLEARKKLSLNIKKILKDSYIEEELLNFVKKLDEYNSYLEKMLYAKEEGNEKDRKHYINKMNKTNEDIQNLLPKFQEKEKLEELREKLARDEIFIILKKIDNKKGEKYESIYKNRR